MTKPQKRAWEEKRTELQKSHKKINKMAISPYLSVITLNVVGLNFPIKDRVAEWKKIKTHLYPVYKTFTSDVRTQTDWK